LLSIITVIERDNHARRSDSSTDYPARTIPLIIRDKLILETVTEKQPIIEAITENVPPDRLLAVLYN
jgi:hypothetical protein